MKQICLPEVLHQGSRTRKIFKDFWRNGIYTQYFWREIQAITSRNDMHVKYMHKKNVLSRDIIWQNKTYREYV